MPLWWDWLPQLRHSLVWLSWYRSIMPSDFIPSRRCVCVYIHALACTHTHTHTHITYIHILHTYINRYIHTCIHFHIHMYIHTYMHTYVYTYIHTYIPIYIHTYIHTYLPIYIHPSIDGWIDRGRVSEDKLLRNIFGLKRGEVTVVWRRLHNEELHDLYCTPNILLIKLWRMRWAGHVACVGDRRGAYRILVGRPDGRRSRKMP